MLECTGGVALAQVSKCRQTLGSTFIGFPHVDPRLTPSAYVFGLLSVRFDRRWLGSCAVEKRIGGEQ